MSPTSLDSPIIIDEGICPKSFDPLTIEENPSRRTIRIVTGAEGKYNSLYSLCKLSQGMALDGVLNGRFEFSFGPSSSFLNANANELSSEECSQVLSKNLKGVTSVNCTREEFNPSRASGVYKVVLEAFPLDPHENNIFVHNGNPPIQSFRCNSTGMDVEDALNPYCEIEDTYTTEVIPRKHLFVPFRQHVSLLT